MMPAVECVLLSSYFTVKDWRHGSCSTGHVPLRTCEGKVQGTPQLVTPQRRGDNHLCSSHEMEGGGWKLQSTQEAGNFWAVLVTSNLSLLLRPSQLSTHCSPQFPSLPSCFPSCFLIVVLVLSPDYQGSGWEFMSSSLLALGASGIQFLLGSKCGLYGHCPVSDGLCFSPG
jgi:hypothetical protein